MRLQLVYIRKYFDYPTNLPDISLSLLSSYVLQANILYIIISIIRHYFFSVFNIPCGLVARIRRFHRRGRGSIPRKGDMFDLRK